MAGNGAVLGPDQWPLVATGAVAAFTGVLVGKQFLHKVTMKTVQNMTEAMLLVIAAVLGAGII